MHDMNDTTHKQAAEALSRLIASAFGHQYGARISIPGRLDHDDDFVMRRYLQEVVETIDAKNKELPRIAHAWREAWISDDGEPPDVCEGCYMPARLSDIEGVALCRLCFDDLAGD